MSVAQSTLLFYPTLYPLHPLPAALLESEKFYFPRPVSLSSEQLVKRSDAIFLLDNGSSAPFLWLGATAQDSPAVRDLFADWVPTPGKVKPQSQIDRRLLLTF